VEEILAFVRFWKKHTGALPTELVLDSRLTTSSPCGGAPAKCWADLRPPDLAWLRIDLRAALAEPNSLDPTTCLNGFIALPCVRRVRLFLGYLFKPQEYPRIPNRELPSTQQEAGTWIGVFYATVRCPAAPGCTVELELRGSDLPLATRAHKN
jgi:hypothetical protein